MTLKRNQEGFTIIEVVLVLAIAGLIFLMIFIALPALQRGQRDTGRKNDVSTVASAVNTFRSNNKNSISTLTSTTLQGYIDSLAQYEKTAATVSTTTPATATASPDTIEVYKNAKCGAISGATVTITGSNARAAIVITGLENNGSTVVGYCQDA